MNGTREIGGETPMIDLGIVHQDSGITGYDRVDSSCYYENTPKSQVFSPKSRPQRGNSTKIMVKKIVSKRMSEFSHAPISEDPENMLDNIKVSSKIDLNYENDFKDLKDIDDDMISVLSKKIPIIKDGNSEMKIIETDIVSEQE